MLTNFAAALDRIGLRRFVAKAANVAYTRQHFSVDACGRWVNHQPECSIVSSTIHTAKFEDFREVVLDNWAQHYLPQSGDTVIDLGAGVGEEAVVFSTLVGQSGKIISIEAHPETYACLSETVRRSGLTNVIPIHCAVSDANGMIKIGDGFGHLANSILSGGVLEIPQRTLGAVAGELDRIDFLRLNIEGAERQVFRGAGDVIAKVRNIAVSCHDFIAQSTGDDTFRTKIEVRQLLESFGFDVKSRTPEAGKPWVGDYLYATRAS